MGANARLELQSRLPRTCLLCRGMTPDNSKVQAVQEWPRPRDANEVRQFIGLASYCQKYVQHFADIARSLHRLTQKETTYCWTEECKQAFRNLMTKLIEAPILAYPTFQKEPDQPQYPVNIQAIPRRYPDQNRRPPERYGMGSSLGRASN